MPGIVERLAILVDLDGSKAVAEMQKVGRSAERDLGKTDDMAKKVSTGMMVAGAGMVAAGTLVSKALSGMSDDFVQAGKDTLALQRATGDTAEEASRLRFAAQQTGTSVDTLSTGLKFLSKNMVAGKPAFDQLGISTNLVSGEMRNTHDVLYDVADAFAGMDDVARKTDLALKIFGRGGTDLLPMLNRGGQALRELEAQAKSYGLELSGENLAAVKANIKAHRELDAAAQGVKVQIGTGVTGALNSMLGPLVSGAKWFAQLDPGAKAAAGSLGMFGGTALVAGGSGLMLVGTLIKLKSTLDQAKAAGGALSTMASGLGPITIGVAGVAAAWSIWNAKMAEGQAMADQLGETVQAKIGRSSFGEASSYLQTLNGQINDLHGDWVAWDSDMKSHNPMDNLRALGDADYINDAGAMSQKLLEQREALIKNVEAARQKAQADGIGIEDAWQMIQAEERLRQIREANPRLTDEEAKAIAGVGDASADAKKKLEDLARAEQDRNNALLGAIGAQQGQEQAWDRFNVTLAKLNDLTATGKGGTQEYNAALRDLRDNAESVAQANQKRAIEDAKARGEEVSSIQQARIYRDSLEEITARFPALQAQTAAWLKMANATVTTQWMLRLGVADDSPLMGLLNRMATLPASANPLDDIRASAQYIVGTRAKGGPVEPNEPYLVGEDGPELIVPRHPGFVVPNGSLQSTPVPAADSQGQVNITVNVHGVVGDHKAVAAAILDEIRREGFATVGSDN